MFNCYTTGQEIRLKMSIAIAKYLSAILNFHRSSSHVCHLTVRLMRKLKAQLKTSIILYAVSFIGLCKMQLEMAEKFQNRKRVIDFKILLASFNFGAGFNIQCSCLNFGDLCWP